MAEVFLAVAMGKAGFSKLQVLKRLRPNLAEDAELCDMFLDEARLAARLNHKNVVQTNEVDLVDGHYFMAMEYLDGQPFHRVLSRAHRLARPIPLPAVSRILCEALNGLHYAHDLADYDGTPLGIVHRDVSPQNVFVTYDGQVKIVDFGIAKAARRVVETQTGVIKGKVSYMAPEQAFSSSADIDRRADIFSVGVILWEVLAGRRLWQGLGDPQIIAALIHAVPGIRGVKPDVDPELARIVDRALALSRDDRYPTAAALRADLERTVPPCSAEELGVFVDGLFGEQRAEIKALIARQIDIAERDGEGELLELDRGSLPRGSRVPPSIPPSSSAPRSFAGVAASETPPPSTITSRLRADPTPTGSALQSAAFADEGAAPRRTPWLVATVVLAGAAVGAYLLLDGSREPARGAAAADSASATPPPPVSAVQAAPGHDGALAPNAPSIQVHLGAIPKDARILVDGAVLPSNPFDGKFVKDGLVHRLQFDANGFLPQNRMIVFDKDLAVDVPLVPRPRQAEPAGSGMKPNPYQ
jgi:serine/threonine-protein kinase